jgi:hypothetical protein
MNGKALSLLVFLLSVTSCEEKVASSNSTPISALASSTSEVVNEVKSLSGLAPTTTSFLPFALTAGTWWDDADVAQICDEREDDCTSFPKISGREYMAIQLDPNAVRENSSQITIFGHLKSALMVFCAFGETLSSSDYTGNNIKVGDYKIVLTAANAPVLKSRCGLDLPPNQNMTISLTVTANSNSTVYDRTINLCEDESGACATPKIKYMYKITPTLTNIAVLETSEEVQGTQFWSRTLVKMSKAAQTTTVEFISGHVGTGAPGPAEGVEVRRLYKENNIGLILFSFYGANNPAAYAVKGNVENNANQVEMAFNDFNTSYFQATFHRVTGAFNLADNTGAHFGSSGAIVSALYSGNYNSANYYTPNLSMSDTVAPNFSSFVEVFSQALPLSN